MSRRIEVELTSARPDGTWTWRAAGAREPKGVVDGSLLPEGAKAGDVLRVDAEFEIDGISIIAVLPPKKASRKEPERLEIIGSGRSFEPVTSTLVDKRDRPRRDRGERPRRGPDGERRERRDRPPRREGDTGPRERAAGRERVAGEARPARPRRERPARPPVPPLPEKPKPKRLKAGRAHRRAILDSLPDEQKPVAEQVLRGGVPAVREALKEQNAKLKAEGKQPISPDGIVALAEELLPKLRVAEWLDRAEAALADLDELDLRDLRSVVVAASDPVVARDEATRELAERLREGLNVRQEREHQEWLSDIDTALGVGRVVRALRLSSRPPKAGVRFPPELGARLAEAAGAALSSDAPPDRWVAVLEAVAYSPVRTSVTPAGLPTNLTDELKATIAPFAGQVPQIAAQLGIEPPPPGARPPRPPRRPTTARKPKPASSATIEERAQPAPAAGGEPDAEAAATDPETVAAPETAAEPEAAPGPEATAEPEPAPAEPEATAEPEPATEPEAVTAEPEPAPAEPEAVTAEAEAPGEPERQAAPAEPQATTELEPETAEPATSDDA